MTVTGMVDGNWQLVIVWSVERGRTVGIQWVVEDYKNTRG